MSKMKKYFAEIVILMISIICLLSNFSGVKAASKYKWSSKYKLGKTFFIDYSSYEGHKTLFCVEKNQHQYSEGRNYKIIGIADITGLDATIKTNKHKDGIKKNGLGRNAKLAYIISQSKHADAQDGVWQYIKTWIKHVGKDAGIPANFATRYTTDNGEDVVDDADSYMDKLKKADIENKTNKNAIKVESYNNQYKIGPFKWKFNTALSEITVYGKKDDKDNQKISGVKFAQYKNKTLEKVSVKNIKSDKDFYLLIPSNGNYTEIQKITAKSEITTEGAKIYFLQCVEESWQNIIAANPKPGKAVLADLTDKTTIPLLGNLKVEKVIKGATDKKLSGVGFIIQKTEEPNKGKYVKKNGNNIEYVSKESDATEFVTGTDGTFKVDNLLLGKYKLIEKTVPYYGFEKVDSEVEVKAPTNSTTGKYTTKQIGNEQKYIKLSGYVWVDGIDGKNSKPNYYYDYDNNSDQLLENVKVELVDKTNGSVVKSTTTKKISDGNGKDGQILRYYQFTEVETENLDKYYVRFTYDGLTYKTVSANINANNGSKAIENSNDRTEFNNKFSVVQGVSETTGETLDQNGNKAYDLSYTKDKEQHTSTLNNNGLPTGQFPITANTSDAGYDIKSHFTYGQEEIPYINLGLEKIEQPDLALIKDMQNVRLSVNGYEHVYKYAQRFKNQGGYGDGFNVGVKFGTGNYDKPYTRAIYKSDYEYVNEADASKELKVYITYRIAVRNESTNLVSQVNSLVDYYDSNYQNAKKGSGVNEKGELTGDVETLTTERYNDKYSKAIINMNTKIEKQKQEEIYVQFELSRTAVASLLQDQTTLDNVVEINSYTTFDKDDKGNLYVRAGVDVDSNPGNAIPGDKSTYEDDTDSSPSLKLELADARELTGKVFLDSIKGVEDLKVGQVREGDGKYKDGEKGIKDVNITFKENTGSGKTYTATTDENGDFIIKDYIPGDYTLTYTWGDKTYTVQNYKGTIYDKNRYNQNIANKEWYKNDVETRWTDAVDNYETRKAIDAELTKIDSETTPTIDKMDSTTPTMGIGVEYDTTTTASSGDKYTYVIKNIDFGIVERARQNIELEKRVKSMKVTLANGQTLVNVTIDANGNIDGEKSSLTYLAPSPSNANGTVKLEMDSELIQGSKLEVTYEIKAVNRSELDYISEDFYKYGEVKGSVVTIKPSKVIDYLDSDWDFNSDNNSGWIYVNATDGDLERNNIKLKYDINNTGSIKDRKILYTTKFEKDLKPTEEDKVELNTSKILTSSGDIELDNESEIIEITKTGGGTPKDSTPGNYEPGKGPYESDDSRSEKIIITPNTGENHNYIVPIAVIMSAFIILGSGIVFIKKKVLNK